MADALVTAKIEIVERITPDGEHATEWTATDAHGNPLTINHVIGLLERTKLEMWTATMSGGGQ